MHRRDFIRTAGGAAGAATAVSAGAGTAVAAEEGGGSGEKPDFGGYLDGANNYEGSVVDATGQDEVTVEVGAGEGLAFGPAAVHVDNGATVVWEWTGNGGAHNVVSDDGTFESGGPVGEAGTTFEYTFEEDGIYNYYCSPHQSVSMLASVVVGTDYPKTSGSEGGHGGGEINPRHMGVPFQAHFVGLATMLMMVVSLVFTFFLLKYGETPHAKGGND